MSWTPSWATKSEQKNKYKSERSTVPCSMKLPGPCPEKIIEAPPSPPPVIQRVMAPCPEPIRITSKPKDAEE